MSNLQIIGKYKDELALVFYPFLPSSMAQDEHLIYLAGLAGISASWQAFNTMEHSIGRPTPHSASW